MQARLATHLNDLTGLADVVLAILEIGVFEREDPRDREGSSFAGHNVP